MLQYKLRTTEKQRHANRKNLRLRVLNHVGDSFVIDGDHDDIVNRFGQVMTKGDRHIIILKGEAYKIVFNETNATLYTKSFDPTAPVMS